MSTENKRFPGRENYTGPTAGWFGLLHHDELYEKSHDVLERVAYVKQQKPETEIATRLHNMIHLNPLACPAILKRDALDADYRAKCDALDADYWAKRAPLDADYRAKYTPLDADYRAKCTPLNAEILAYIKREIPDCAWNGRELVFPTKKVLG